MSSSANFRSDAAQDLVEYALLLGFIALVAAGSVLQTGEAVTNLWAIMGGRFAAAGS